MSKEHGLTPKQFIFCKEYLVDMNASRAIVAAGYSKNSADTQGSRMLRNVKVKAYIDKMTSKRAEKLDITAENVLNEISHIAFFNIKNVFDGDSLKQIDKIDNNTARAIGSIKARVEKVDGDKFAEITEIKSNDKLKALDMLSKHLGLYERDNEQSDNKNNLTVEEISQAVAEALPD